MKIIIGHSNSRRVIEGEFSLVGEPHDLLNIAEQIQQQVGDWDNTKFAYGTVWIAPRKHYGPNNAESLHWDAEGGYREIGDKPQDPR